MSIENEVELWEDHIKKDLDGNVIHHPLNSLYALDSQKGISHGHLTFCGHDMSIAFSPLQDIHVFYLEFSSKSIGAVHREAWADPLRLEVLKRLSQVDRSWYFGFIADPPIDGFNESLPKFQQDPPSEHLRYVVVKSEKPAIYGAGFVSKLFVEAPNSLLPLIFSHYWTTHIPGFPIEGYNMPSGQIGLLADWDKRDRDASLFREVLDQSFITFYTVPAEHRDFAFVTNKLGLDDLRNMIDLDDLQKRAKQVVR